MTGDGRLAARPDALDVFVELLSDFDAGAERGGRALYDRLCEAVCRLTSMERAILFLYDDARKLVLPAGSQGVDPELLSHLHGTLEETPMAQRALAEDRVVEASERLEREVPERYARFPGVTTLTCTPVTAGGRWLGVVFADRGGGCFELTDEEGQWLCTLGKMAALAASAQIATRHHEQARLLAGRIDLAREVHERVMQRLFACRSCSARSAPWTRRRAAAARRRRSRRSPTCARPSRGGSLRPRVLEVRNDGASRSA